MRSPWLFGAVGLGWLALASVLASGPVQILVLWAIGLAVGVAFLGRQGATQQTAPQSPATTVQPATTSAASAATPLRIVTAEEVATMLNVDLAVVVDAIQSGELPGNQLAGQWRCNEESLRRWLDGSWL